MYNLYMEGYNPFNPNSVVAPSLFAGRTDQINDICRKLTQLRHNMSSGFFLYGERGIGKTALAKLINYIATANDEEVHGLNLLTSYYQVEKDQSLSSVLQESLNKLTNQMDKTLVAEIGSRLGQLFKNGKFEIGAFGMASISMEASAPAKQAQDITVKDQTVSILSNIVKSLGVDKEKGDNSVKKDGILIIIDEIHNLKDLSSAASILRNIVTSLDFDELGKVSFLLIGYKEDVDQFFSVDTSSRRLFDLKRLDVMPESEAIEVLKKGFEAASIKWDETALISNISVAGGYPHSIQRLGHNLVEIDKDNMIDDKDWNSAIYKTALDLQDKDFSTMYTFRKSHTEKDKVLAYLAKENKPVQRKEIKDKLEIKNIYRCLTDLKKLGAIKEDDSGAISLQSQLFRVAILFDVAWRGIQVKKSKVGK